MAGVIIRFVIPGAGGWGDPFTRDPTAVAEDVRDGKLTPAYVRQHYRVVIDEAGKLDAAATASLRNKRRHKGSAAR